MPNRLAPPLSSSEPRLSPVPDYAEPLERELRRCVRGEVRFDRQARALYAYDASIFRQVPIGAVLPADAEDVEAALAARRHYGAPVFGRGCGTGLAGQTVNAAVVFDFSRYMNAIVEMSPQQRTARVQPGVICDQLRDAAEEHGLTFGPDPPTHDHATLGGMMGNNSCGTHSVMAGKTVDNIEALDIVTYDGLRMRVGATSPDELEEIIAAGGRRGAIYAGLRRLRDTYAALVGTRPSEEGLEQCDALLIVGSTMPYIEFYPAPGQGVCVQIDDKPERIGLRHPVDVGLVGDAKATLAELLPLLSRNDDRSFLQQAQEGMKEWWALMAERGTRTDRPMKPQVPAWALNDVLAPDAIICGDSGTVTSWAARQIKVRKQMMFSFSGTNCSMAAGLPYAIGAATAFPGRQVVVFTGDGSLTMQLGDFLTAVQHRLPIKIVVVKNNTLGLIKWEQMVYLGNREYGVNFAPLDFVKFAEAAGARGMRIKDPATCAEQMREAFAWDGPVIVECVVDQHEPPIPAKVTRRQVTSLFEALRAGTPNRNRIALQMVKDMLDESSFQASPGHHIPDAVGRAAAGLAGRLRDRAEEEHPQ